MSDEHKSTLRLRNLSEMLKEPPDPRPVYCPDCRGETIGGWCDACGFDWCDGCTDQLRAANPHLQR